jgi:hypothetical protein
MPKFKYNLINAKGEQEPFSGVFKDEAEADRWYEKHGRKWESEGRTLVKTERLRIDK